MPETLLALIPEAAGHELLGGGAAFYSGAATADGTTTTLVCDDLVDPSGAQTYRNWWAYFHTSAGAPSIAGERTTLIEYPVDGEVKLFVPLGKEHEAAAKPAAVVVADSRRR